MKLSKIAVLVAFLAAFAIPWLAATAHGADRDGSLTIAEQQVVPAKPAAPGSEVKAGSESSPQMDQDDEDWDYEEPEGEQPDQDLEEPGEGLTPQAPAPAGGTH